MRELDSNYDDVLKVSYTLHSIRLSELKKLAESWYENTNLAKFDARSNDRNKNEKVLLEMKLSGVICNYFYAYQEGDKYYLLDGYNRLFTDYGKLDVDPIVYIKIINEKCSDDKLMSIMFRLNMWKLKERGVGTLKTQEFLDRGFRLFMKKKFNVFIYDYSNSEWGKRKRDNTDFEILNYYFRSETKSVGYFPHNLDNIFRLFSHKNVVKDFRQITKINSYLEQPFNNYETFVFGFVMFLSWRRVSGDDGTYKFTDYLERLKQDKFYKKLTNMSWTDSTRINVFNFFRATIKN
tara:strand:- start:8358 stop:9236 length:879 start_codon:yes stop_codon:yes gene_type:complete